MKPIGLDILACRMRQERLRAYLERFDIAAALLTDARQVCYFTGHWTRSVWPAALIVHRDASTPTTLVAGMESAWPVAVDEVSRCSLHREGTIVDDAAGIVWQCAMEALLAAGITATPVRRIGVDHPPPVGLRLPHSIIALGSELRRMRRHKDPDEIELIRRGVAACDACYARVREILAPGLSEMDIYAEVLATAARVVGAQGRTQ